MLTAAQTVPEETDLLCEGCGYTLNGLPPSSNCPECGKPIEESVGSHRHLSAFEQSPSISNFIATSYAVIFTPRRFYRNLSTREQTSAAARFAIIHLFIATLLFTVAAIGHEFWIFAGMWHSRKIVTILFLVVFPILFFLMIGLKRLATWPSAIEARYWGMRLPHVVVSRGLQFHTAHYLPVALLAACLVAGYQSLLTLGIVDRSWDVKYLTMLCVAVVGCAGYLFQAYWIAMKSMMYANR